MSGSNRSDGKTPAVAPSMLDLVRLSPRLLFPPGGRDLYRQIALLSDMAEGNEVLVVGSGNGVTLDYFVQEYGVHGSGVDFDESMVAAATARAREKDVSSRLQFQEGPFDRLPYRDGIFDVAVGELGLTAHADPVRAVEELVRVTRPGGTVVAVQLAWKAPVEESRRRLLSEYLGVRPLMLVEWKRIMREVGLERIHIEDWTDEQTAFRPRIVKPFPDFAELFSLPEKIGILHRAWRRWGWPGVKIALAREREVHGLLTEERILGLHLLKGVTAERPGATSGTLPEDVSDESPPDLTVDEPAGDERMEGEPPPGPAESKRETAGLPLFGPENTDG